MLCLKESILNYIAFFTVQIPTRRWSNQVSELPILWYWCWIYSCATNGFCCSSCPNGPSYPSLVQFCCTTQKQIPFPLLLHEEINWKQEKHLTFFVPLFIWINFRKKSIPNDFDFTSNNTAVSNFWITNVLSIILLIYSSEPSILNWKPNQILMRNSHISRDNFVINLGQPRFKLILFQLTFEHSKESFFAIRMNM